MLFKIHKATAFKKNADSSPFRQKYSLLL